MPFCHCLSHFSSWKPEFSWAVFCHAALICPQFVHHLLFILSLFYYFPPDALNSVLRGFNECIPHKIFLFYHCYLFQFASHYQLKGVASHGFILITPSVNAFFFLFPKNKQTHLKSLLGPDFLHLLLSIALTVKCASLPVASAHKNIPAIRISPGCGIEQNRGKSNKKTKNKFKMGFSCRLCSPAARRGERE